MQGENWVEKLIGILAQEASLLRLFLILLDEEREAIISRDLERLSKINKEKESLASKLQELERERILIMENLSSSQRCASQKFTLNSLSRQVKEPYAVELNNHRSEILSLVDKLKRANQRNKSLILSSLEFVQGALTLLQSLSSSKPIYQRDAKMKKGFVGGRMVSGRL